MSEEIKDLAIPSVEKHLPANSVIDGGDITSTDDNWELFLELGQKIASAPEYDVFPSQIKQNCIQKVYVYTGEVAFRSGTEGQPNRYVLFHAMSQFFQWEFKVLFGGTPFRFMIPAYSWWQMFAKSAAINFTEVIKKKKELTGEYPVFEIHFIKRTERSYELVYLAHVEFNEAIDTKHGTEYYFNTLSVLFRNDQYEKKRQKKLKESKK